MNSTPDRLKCFIFIDDEMSLSLPGEPQRFRAVETGKRLSQSTGMICHPITARNKNGIPISDVAVLADAIEFELSKNGAVALVVDVIQHYQLRKGLELIEFLRRARPNVLNLFKAVILISKDRTVKVEQTHLAELCPNQTVEILDRNTEFERLVEILKSLR